MAGLKKGGGVGRKGGFGYLHYRRFAEPFADTVREVMKSNALPAADSVDACLTLHIIADLKTKWAQNVMPIYSEEVQAHDDPSWNTVSDLVRRYAYGTHKGAVLPKYMSNMIEKISDLRWKTFFYTQLIIKHSHGVVQYQTKKGQKGCHAALIDLQGEVVPQVDGRPPEPQEKDFFNTVSLDANAKRANTNTVSTSSATKQKKKGPGIGKGGSKHSTTLT